MTHALAAFVLRRCDRVVVLTDGLRRLVRSQYGVQADRVVAAAERVGYRVCLRPREINACRQDEHLDPTCQYIGFVGGFLPISRFSDLVGGLCTYPSSQPIDTITHDW